MPITGFYFSNNFQGTLRTGITDTQTYMVIEGNDLPYPSEWAVSGMSTDQPLAMTLYGGGHIEIVHLVGLHASYDWGTRTLAYNIEREKDNTTKRAWAAGTVVRACLTQEIMAFINDAVMSYNQRTLAYLVGQVEYLLSGYKTQVNPTNDLYGANTEATLKDLVTTLPSLMVGYNAGNPYYGRSIDSINLKCNDLDALFGQLGGTTAIANELSNQSQTDLATWMSWINTRLNNGSL